MWPFSSRRRALGVCSPTNMDMYMYMYVLSRVYTYIILFVPCIVCVINIITSDIRGKVLKKKRKARERNCVCVCVCARES